MRTMLVTLVRFGILVVVLSQPRASVAQVNRTPSPNIAVGVDLVLLDVAVHDRDGNLVTNLQREDFVVYEDKIEQPITFLNTEESPVTWGLVLDRSGSIDGMTSDVYESAVHILEEGTSEDEMFIMTFGDRVELVSKLTSDRRKLQDSIFGLKAHGRTPMYDAISSGLDYIKQGKHRKKVLVVITDGEDNHSAMTFKQVLDRVRESDVLVYIVGIRETLGAFRSAIEVKQRLKAFTEATGGYAYFPKTLERCRETMQKIAQEVSEHYTIGYYPANTNHDGSWHKVKVAIRKTDQDKIRYNVRTRSGYYSPLP
jgi:Ca-activated chloride channel homolog